MIALFNSCRKGTMDRLNRLKINSIVGIGYQIIVIAYGILLPRLYLDAFGSDVYGLTTSISQFLCVISLMDLGMGAVVKSSLYEPLAKNDMRQVSCVVSSARKFFRTIALLFSAYVLVLMIVYTFVTGSTRGWLFDSSLILIMAVASFAQYFFGVIYDLLLTADQKSYIPLGLQGLCLLLVVVFSIILINCGASIHLIKLVTTLILLLRPIGQYMYVKAHYSISINAKYEDEPIKQKWNGLAQHIANYVTQNTDVIVLTLFRGFAEVAVYSIYNLITNCVKQLLLVLSSGVQALFGNILFEEDANSLRKKFELYEWIMHFVVTFLFFCTAKLITSFVLIYTKGINDVDYSQPIFALIITIAQAVYCIRFPYETMIQAAGHYKQTQTSSFLEMAINILITLALVRQLGLIGVAIGTFVSLLYRTIYLIIYLSKNIVYISQVNTFRLIVIDVLIIILDIVFTMMFHFESLVLYKWILYAVLIGVIACAISIVINLLFYRNNMKTLIKLLFGKIFTRSTVNNK